MCAFSLIHPLRCRYTHLHPSVSPAALSEVLSYRPQFFRWAGADTFCVTGGDGRGRETIIIECNSCPSGNKSLPFLSDSDEQNGYRRLIQGAFKDLLSLGAPALLPPRELDAAGITSSGAGAQPTKRRSSSSSDVSCATAASVPTVVTAAVTQLAPCDNAADDSASSSDSCGASVISGGAASVPASRHASPSLPAKADVTAPLKQLAATAVQPALPPVALASSASSSNKGVLAVIYDKNPMEAGAYAAAIADACGEPVFKAELYLSGKWRGLKSIVRFGLKVSCSFASGLSLILTDQCYA